MKKALAPAQYTTAWIESARVFPTINLIAAGKSLAAAPSKLNWRRGSRMLARQSSSQTS
jgi:hypothetical protein